MGGRRVTLLFLDFAVWSGKGRGGGGWSRLGKASASRGRRACGGVVSAGGGAGYCQGAGGGSVEKANLRR